MKFKAIIFDLDGTISDTEHIWKKATAQLITSRGIEMNQDLEQELQGHLNGLAIHKSCLFIKNRFNFLEEVEQLIAEKSKYALNLYAQEVRFVEGFTNFHTQVIAYALKHGIATNADEATLQITKQKLGLEKFFGNHIYGISQVNNVCKPDPAIYLHAAKNIGVQPHECIAIEDSTLGIQAAKSAGMFCIGINTGKNRTRLSNSDHIIESYQDLDLKKILF